MIATILQVVGPQSSIALTWIVTGTIWWFGGQRMLGAAEALSMVGAIVSWILTGIKQAVDGASPSDAEMVTRWLPAGRSAVNVRCDEARRSDGAREFV